MSFPTSSRWSHPALLGLVLAALVVVLYSATLRFDFVTIDDESHLLGNRAVLHRDVPGAFLTTPAGLWIPVTWLSFMGEIVLLQGVQPWIFHLTNFLLHAANAVLLWLWLEGATGRRWPAFVVALLFAVHPLNVESVAWVTERKNVLSTFFWLLSLLAYTRYARTGSGRAYLAAFVAAVTGLLAKPMLVTLPFTLLMLDVWPFNRVAAVGWRRLLLEKVPFFVVVGMVCAMTMVGHQQESGLLDADALTVTDRLLNAGTSYGLYLRQLIWPAGLAMRGRHPQDIWLVAGVVGWMVVAGLTVLALALRRRQPAILWGWLWFLGTLVPVIGLLQAGAEPSADRFTYVPQFGFFVALVWGVWPLAARFAVPARIALAAAVAALAGQTADLLASWENGVTLFARAVKISPRSFTAQSSAGYAYARAGDHRRAIHHYRASLELIPAQSETWNNLGASFEDLGDDQRAIFAFREAQKYPPVFAGVRENLERAEKREAERAAKGIPPVAPPFDPATAAPPKAGR